MTENSKHISFLQKLLGDGPVTILHKKNAYFVLDVVYDSECKSQSTYTAGNIQSILKSLKHEPAEAVEIEAAIADIEEQLMPVIKNLPESRCLVTSEKTVGEIAKVAGLDLKDKSELDVETVEEIFNRLVDVAYGTPARMLKVPEGRTFAGSVLFLRELMHHARFTSLIINY